MPHCAKSSLLSSRPLHALHDGLPMIEESAVNEETLCMKGKRILALMIRTPVVQSVFNQDLKSNIDLFLFSCLLICPFLFLCDVVFLRL